MSETRIPVSRVEQGRWSSRSAVFTAAKQTAYPAVRRRIVGSGLEVDDELLQLSAFSSDESGRMTTTVARPSRRTP